MKYRLSFLLLTALLPLTASADEAPHGAPAPAATQPASLVVNGKPISDELFYAYRAEQIKSRPDLARGLSEEQQIRLLNQLLNMVLLSQQAVQQDVDKQPMVAAALDVARMNTLAEAMIGEYLEKHPVTGKEIDATYQADYVDKPATEYLVSHIQTGDRERAEQALAELKAGKSFAEVAKTYSDDATAEQGGDLGWLDSSALSGPVGDKVKALKKGEFSPEVVKSDFGWHVFLLRDSRQLPPPKLTEVRDAIVSQLQKKRLGQWIGELRKQAAIETPRHPRTDKPAQKEKSTD